MFRVGSRYYRLRLRESLLNFVNFGYKPLVHSLFSSYNEVNIRLTFSKIAYITRTVSTLSEKIAHVLYSRPHVVDR